MIVNILNQNLMALGKTTRKIKKKRRISDPLISLTFGVVENFIQRLYQYSLALEGVFVILSET
jgi:hypothetical protein